MSNKLTLTGASRCFIHYELNSHIRWYVAVHKVRRIPAMLIHTATEVISLSDINQIHLAVID
ncbi:MAG TPA: hypothetical protein VGC66_15920 [Pyrinomonadaceae bacterium]